MTDPVAGAVLIGGSSRRMGRDKAAIRDRHGVALAERVATALRDAGCDPVVAVGGRPGAPSPFTGGEPPVVADRWPGEGPLGGVRTALAATGIDTVVAACDLVDLDGETVAAVIAAAHLDERLDAVIALGDRRHHALALWRGRVRHRLGVAFERGERSLQGALAGLTVGEVRVDERRLRNVNTPADLDDWFADRSR